jgi:hypothetical protein
MSCDWERTFNLRRRHSKHPLLLPGTLTIASPSLKNARLNLVLWEYQAVAKSVAAEEVDHLSSLKLEVIT